MKVTAQQLKAEILKRRYAVLLEKPNVFPSQRNWEFIIENDMHELAISLYQKYLEAKILEENNELDNQHMPTLNMFPEYLKRIDRQYALEALYSDTTTNPTESVDLAVKLDLFDINYIRDMLDGDNVSTAAQMLSAHAPLYDSNDIPDLRELIEDFWELPEIGHYERNRGILSGGDRYICPNGHVNNGDVDFCTHEECRLNIKGLAEEDVACIEAFEERVNILEEMLLSPKRAGKQQ